MDKQTTETPSHWKGTSTYVITRSIAALIVIIAVLWGLTLTLRKIEWPPYTPPVTAGEASTAAVIESKQPEGMQTDVQLPAVVPDGLPDVSSNSADGPHALPAEETAPALSEASSGEAAGEGTEHPPADEGPVVQVQAANQSADMGAAAKAPSEMPEPKPSQVASHAPPTAQKPSAAPHEAPEPSADAPVGVALVTAVMGPLSYELNDRSWGWRPNDIINITDNVNNFQLGVLEVTRRAVVQLAQRISRTGSTDAFDPNLENAMNWIMTKATSRWFPSAESKYRDNLKELQAYKNNLIKGSAHFYTRADNLIPLFEVFEDLLGSCDQNLVKQTESDGTVVSTFKADDYFYYAQGVAHAMAVILEGVQIDFAQIMENRRSAELLHHAIESCERAAQIDPWIVTDADLDGILANHRANMAAPISHARYYLGQLVMALST